MHYKFDWNYKLVATHIFWQNKSCFVVVLFSSETSGRNPQLILLQNLIIIEHNFFQNEKGKVIKIWHFSIEFGKMIYYWHNFENWLLLQFVSQRSFSLPSSQWPAQAALRKDKFSKLWREGSMYLYVMWLLIIFCLLALKNGSSKNESLIVVVTAFAIMFVWVCNLCSLQKFYLTND